MKTKDLENYLMKGNKITKLGALKQFGVWNTGDVIYKMRKKGVNVHTEMRTKGNKRFAEYKVIL
jgi:hypothetical protein